ncbi:MAG: hypothetical protein NT078_01585 [Candidatus Azambacteria bacterium]|nr:hypothetical protein [Candidatus Azambacteria bacterium]
MAAFDAIIRGEEIKKPSLPASFNVLVSELKSLGLSVELVEKPFVPAAVEPRKESEKREIKKVRIRT